MVHPLTFGARRADAALDAPPLGHCTRAQRLSVHARRLAVHRQV